MESINLPPNSNKARESAIPKEAPATDKKIEKISVNPVVQRKKPVGRRFMETFFNGATAKGVLQYVFMEVVIPATKDMIADMMSQGVERALFGDARGSNSRLRNRTGSGSSWTNYNRMSQTGGPSRYSRSEEPSRPATPRAPRVQHDFEELVLRTRPEASMVLNRMIDTIQRYGTVSINDVYDMVGLSGNYTDDKFGWTLLDETNSGIRRVRDGYVLDLPQPEPLN